MHKELIKVLTAQWVLSIGWEDSQFYEGVLAALERAGNFPAAEMAHRRNILKERAKAIVAHDRVLDCRYGPVLGYTHEAVNLSAWGRPNGE